MESSFGAAEAAVGVEVATSTAVGLATSSCLRSAPAFALAGTTPGSEALAPRGVVVDAVVEVVSADVEALLPE